MDDPRVTAAIRLFSGSGYDKNSATTIKKMLTAMANSGSAKANRQDVILDAAVHMIEAFEKFIVASDMTGTSGDRS